MEELNNSINKYKELYEYSLLVYKERFESVRHIEEKAFKYQTALTLIIGLAVYYVNWLFNNMMTKINYPCLKCLTFAAIVLLFVALIITWYFIFLVLKVESYSILPITDEVLDFYENNKTIDIYYTMSKAIKDEIIKTTKSYDKKSKILSISFYWLFLDVAIIIINLILYFLNQFQTNV